LSKTLHRVEVQIEAPKGDFPGRTVQGVFTHENGVVTLTDHFGNPVRGTDGKTYSKKIGPEENPRVVAGRMTREFSKARRGKTVNGFDGGPIQYPPLPEWM
jgi:hypothetical protein